MLIVKVPGINGLGKTNGCRNAGSAILESLKEIYSNEAGVSIDVRLLDLEEIHLNNQNLEESHELIYKNSLEILESQLKTIFLGGDHSISYSLGKAFLNHCINKKTLPCLIVFDAHADCMPPMKEPTHEEWLRALVESGFPAQNILLVGVRNIWKEELQFLKEKGIRMISANQLLVDIEDTCDTLMEFSNGKELFVSVDIDVIDPAFAPATGYPVPGGLTSRQFLYLIQRINKIKTLKVIDIVEINSEKDSYGLTIKLGAKILSELI
jgi:arginase family enzyme